MRSLQSFLPEKNKRIRYIIVVLCALLFVTILLRFLTPDSTQLPAIPFTSSFSNFPTNIDIEDATQPVTVPPRLSTYQLKRTVLPRDQIFSTLQVLDNQNSRVWQDERKERNLSINSRSDLFTFSDQSRSGDSDHAESTPIDLQRATTQAVNWFSSVGLRNITSIPGAVTWLSSDPDSYHFEDAEAGLGNIVELKFTFTHENFYFLQDDFSEDAISITVNSSGKIMKATFPAYNIDVTLGEDVVARTQKEALEKTNEAVLLSISQNNIEGITVKDTKALKILNSKLQYRYFNSSPIAYPVYYFEATAKDAKGQEFGLTFIIPATQTAPKES